MSRIFAKGWAVVSSTETHLPYPRVSQCPSMNTDDAYISSQAWSITPNADGTHTWYPERRGPDELRGCLRGCFHLSIFILAPRSISLTSVLIQLQEAVRVTTTIVLRLTTSRQESRPQANLMTSLMTKTGTGTGTGTGAWVTLSLPHSATTEDTPSRTTIIATTCTSTVLSLPNSAVTEGTPSRTTTISAICMKTIQSLP